MDARLRELERQARAGDIQALKRLEEWTLRLSSPEQIGEAVAALVDIQGALNLSLIRELVSRGPEIVQAIEKESKVNVVKSVAGYEAVRAMLDDMPGRVKDTNAILIAYYQGLGYVRDIRSHSSWLKPLPNGQYRKITITERGRNYKIFRGRPGSWAQTHSLVKSKVVKEILATVLDKATTHKAQKVRKAAKTEATKTRKEATELGIRVWALEFNRSLDDMTRGEILYKSLTNKLDMTPDVSRNLPDTSNMNRARLSVDSALIDSETPPCLFEQDGRYANAQSKKLPSMYETRESGKLHRLKFERKSNTMVITIGELGIDPISGRMTSIGSNGISGYIRASEGSLIAHLFMWVVEESRKGEGTRLMNTWCRILKAYGLPGFVGDAVGAQGKAALEAMERKGQLQIVGWHGSHAALSCGQFDDPNQMRLF